METNSYCSTSTSTSGTTNCDSEDGICAGPSNTLQIKEVDRTRNTNGLLKITGHRCYTEEEEEEDFTEDQMLSQMGYGKSETRRDAELESEWQDDDEEDQEEDDEFFEQELLAQMGYLKNEPPKHEPITTPLAELNLVSALKGSREREGNTPKDHRVSWSPDVYDPTPTCSENLAMSNSVKNKDPMKVKGLAGKNRQKTAGKGLGVIDDGGSKGKGGKGGGKASPAAVKDKKKIDKKVAKKHGDRGCKYSEY